MPNRPDSGIPKKFMFQHFPNQIDPQTGSDFPNMAKTKTKTWQFFLKEIAINALKSSEK